MNKFEHKPGAGSLLQSRKRREKAPDYFGEIRLEVDKLQQPDAKGCVMVKLSGWIKETPAGHLIKLTHNTFVPDPDWKPKRTYPSNPTEQLARNQPREFKGKAQEIDDDEVPF